MGRRNPTSQSLSVPVLLNEAQRASASGHIRYAKVMWELQGENATETLQQLVFGVKLFMTVPEKNIYQDRLLRFMATFASETKSQDQVEFVEELLGELVELSYAKDHVARWRACQMIHCIMGSLPADAALSDDAADSVQAAMLDHLDDGKPNVRAAAVRALARLPIPDDDGDFTDCPVTSALVELLASDKSKDVRKAVLASLPAGTATAEHLVERTRDEADDVRRVTYLAIAEKVRLEALGASSAALLVRRGLGDRTPAVSEAAAAMVTAWLDHACGGEPLALLRQMDAEKNPKEAESALKALLESGRLNAVHIAKLAAEDGLGLRADFSGDAPLMGGEEALFWRVVCECLASEATSKGLAAATGGGAAANIDAAAAGDRLEALEAALPSAVEEIIQVIALHAHAGTEHRFATAQLMTLTARCVDFTDATGRRAAAALLQDILVAECDAASAQTEASNDVWASSVGNLLRKVHAAPSELSDAMLSALGILHEKHDFRNGQPTEVAWLGALRATALLLESLPNARSALAAATPFGLLDTLHEIIQPGLLHDSTMVRREAVRCLGLYCLLDGVPTPLSSHLPVLRSYLASPSQPLEVRAVAAQAVGDLALQRGVKALDSLLVAEAEVDPVVGAEPTVDLMLGVLRSWQDAFAEVVGAVGRRRRGAPSATASDVEAVAELGTAVVEALARLVAVNEFRQDSDQHRGEVSALEDGEVLRLLVALLLLNFDAATEPAARLRQCLTVFFERFAALSVTSQQYLATSLLPAARSAVSDDIEAGRTSATSSPVAPQVVRFTLQLLQLPVIGRDGTREPLGHEPLAELVLGEILGCARRTGVPKPYMSALCKLPLALPMYDAGDETRETMLRIQVYAAHAAEQLQDKILRKDMEATFERYSPPGADQPQLSNEQVDALLEGVKAHVEAFCTGFPMPFGDEDDKASVPAVTKSRGTAVKRPAARATSSSSDEEESDSDAAAEPAGPARRMPSRANRVAKTLAESSDDEEVVPGAPVAAVAEQEEDSDEDNNISSEEEEEESDGDDQEENIVEQRPSARKARRASNASVAALREALRENAKIAD